MKKRNFFMTLFVLLCMTITSVNAQVNLALDSLITRKSLQQLLFHIPVISPE